MKPKEAYEKCYKENKRILELEKIILLSPEWSYNYTVTFIKKRWKKAENIISKNSTYSYFYASDIIHGRWLEAETTISQDSYYSYRYAKNIIEGPFEKCHHIIFNSEYSESYINFLKSINYNITKISEWLI